MPITGFSAGGLGAGFAPEEWAAYALDNLSAASVLLASGATEVRTVGKAVHVPTFTGDAATCQSCSRGGAGSPPDGMDGPYSTSSSGLSNAAETS